MISIACFTFNAFQENTYVISSGGEAVIIDPGCSNPSENSELEQYIKEHNLKPVLLLNTHCHIDHVLGNEWVKNKFQLPFLIHSQEKPVLESVKVYAPNYGYPTYQEATPDRFLTTGENIEFGNTACKVLFVPGHSPGHVGFYFEEEQKLFAGDVLFRESIGRTDLPGGDYDTLIESIRNELFVLPEDIEVFPGHGPSTTIGHEKLNNPFCAEHLFKNSHS